jgi:hypothetical protein
VDVQPPGMGVGDKEVFAIVLAPEEPHPAGEHIAFDQVLAERRTCHGSIVTAAAMRTL